MSTIVTRSGKGSPLTHVEVDANFTNLNTDKVEKTSAAITGGTINGTTVGSTTPAAGTFTTITGQTEVLKGTGSNLLLYSEDFSTIWATSGTASVTTNTTTAPDGTNTADTLSNADNITYNTNNLRQNKTSLVSSTPYTFSVYVKSAGATTGAVAIRDNTTGGNTTSSFTPTASWQRVSVTATTGSSTTSVFPTIGGTNGNLYIWGAQLEIGSTVNTYIPTTASTVYGTPTLSFSGVAGLGLESNGSLYVSPAGTGAIQAQATTSSTVGGNARGANAVDWQTARSAASQVASSAYTVVSGGVNNTASGFNATINGGTGNTGSATYSFGGGGYFNTASGVISSVVGGYSNTAAGFYNFIGSGYQNSGTALSAVTTQSGTMNGTTAVTLSGSNANIKVGQLISGTSISSFPHTYVAAISGTSLTLSQNASGSSTSTLSFYTPHGVVVGGGNNQATGSYSFIGGGGDAGTAANRNVASGDWSTVGGGFKNTIALASSYSVIAGGSSAAITGNGFSFIGSGFGHTISTDYASILGGYSNNANGRFSSILGGGNGNTRSIQGNQVSPASFGPIDFASGVSQSSLLVLGRQTTDATPTVLASSSAAAGTTNQVILPNNSAYFFRGEVVSGVTGGGNTKGWTIEGVIKRGANAASTALVGTPTVTSLYADAGAATWTIAVTADTTNGGLRVTFTGQAATTIRTVCQIRTTEVTY